MKRKPTDRKRSGPTAGAAPTRSTAPPPDGGPEVISRLQAIGLCLASVLLSLPLFAPVSFWPLGYVVFVPWLVAMAGTGCRCWAYIGSYLLGAGYFLFHFRWLTECTPEGHAAASLLYLAWAFPLAAWPIRHLYRRRRISLAMTFPVVWTAIEILRTYNPLGFPWFFLGHTQIKLLPMVQIADLAGVYGVTFVVAMVNGVLADWALKWVARRRGGRTIARPGLLVAGPAALVVVAATFAYGQYRLAQSRFEDGPLTAVLQGDFVLRAMVDDPEGASEEQKEQAYLVLLEEAARQDHPDLIVLPETPWGMCLNPEAVRPGYRYWQKRWPDIVRTANTSIVVGAMAEEPQPPGTYPPQHRYNSAFLYTPGAAVPQRYDKIHLVPFGEYVPFRYSRYFRFIYEFFAFNRWNPWGRDGYEYSLTPGREFTVMKLPQAASGRNGRFGVTICYEDVVPRVFRRCVYGDGGKRVDFMLNISNDGWFGHGTQQAQHLVNCAFRAIENRIGVARAVNTGISGFIDPDGRWRDLVQEPGRGLHPGGTGYRAAHVKLDPRVTVYSRVGDLFGIICLALTMVGVGDAILGSVRRRRARRAAKQTKKTV